MVPEDREKPLSSAKEVLPLVDNKRKAKSETFAHITAHQAQKALFAQRHAGLILDPRVGLLSERRHLNGESPGRFLAAQSIGGCNTLPFTKKAL